MVGALPLPPGGILPYIYIMGMCRPKGCDFCAVLVWKRVETFLFWTDFSYGFRGNAWTYLSFQSQMNKKEREICEFEVDFNKSFCWHSNLSNDNIISAYVTSENECGKWQFLVWNRVRIWRTGQHTPYQEFPKISPRAIPLLTPATQARLARWTTKIFHFGVALYSVWEIKHPVYLI